MYTLKPTPKTGLKVNNSVEGEPLERKVERMVNNKEPMGEGAPLIYTERKDGVSAGYNIRTDRFEVALDATDKMKKTIDAKREEKAKMEVVRDQSIQANQKPE